MGIATIDVSICTDCAIWHANGDTSGIDCEQREQRVKSAPGVPAGYSVAVTGDDNYFSWRNCDTCRAPLGGDRIDAVLLLSCKNCEDGVLLKACHTI